MLDSVQGRGPCLAFLPFVSLPELEGCIVAWDFFETIHSRSYTHIIRNIYPNPSTVFDNMLDVKEIVECGNDIAKYYDQLIKEPNKKNLWMCLMSANALEGIRFYVSFACSWAFAELKKMEGNAKIIKFIARDENTHLASTITMLKLLRREPGYEKIAKETEQECIDLFSRVIEQEKDWAKYLFQDGSMIGLNETINLPCPYTVSKMNPLPWTEKWISGGNVQVAPQETEISSYVVGGVKQDVDSKTLSGLSL